MAPRPFRVDDIWDELDDTFTLELASQDGSAFEFQPGQFNMLYVFGIGEVPLSVCGDPTRPETVLHTIRGVGPVTRALRNVQPGDVVGLRGPFGVPWPLHLAEGGDVVVVAGGIGLAPLRPAIYSLLANRRRFERLVFLYGARSPTELLYPEELFHWGGRFDVDVLVSVDNADRSWHGSVGVVTKLIPRAPFDPHRTTAFVCGPEIMMRFSGKELVDRGVHPDRVFLSMERNMKCAIAFCGHCQFGPHFVCRDGPVFPWAQIEPLLWIREV